MASHLLLMRHAKSSWDDSGLSDHERPLNKRGRRASGLVARTLVARGYAPDVIWSSDAARTLETAKRLIRIIPGAQTVHHNPALYHASANTMLTIMQRESEPGGRLMIMAHNPGMAELYNLITGHYHRFPTGACAVFKRIGKAPWHDPQSWRVVDMVLPRDLEAE
ncbi:histidine phosphatase family protein [Fretibacter rubidus]|uniref:SixA phosphatase family protein n=1 Tax=Fretibacter rubidus TaxID=570162 RepID=UPI00352AEDE7